MWWVASYQDLVTLLRDRRLGRQIDHVVNRTALGLPARAPDLEPFYALSDNSMFDKEPPEHTRLKNLVHKVFTPRRVRSLRGEIQRLANHLLDAVAGQDTFDLLADFAEPLPVEVIAALLGVPEPDRHLLRPWSAAIVQMFELDPTPDTALAAVQASNEFTDYLRDLARARRRDPQDDLISALVQVEDQGDTLSEEELIATCVFLLNAGHEATVNGFGNGMRAFFLHPDQFQRLKDHRNLIPSAVEEMLRWDTPSQLFRRWVLADMDYHGHAFKLGQEVAFLFGAANRDPAVFENPQAFDIGRVPNPHISFGMGIHFCLGAPLARLEMAVALETLLTRYIDLQLVEEPVFKPGFVLRGLEALITKPVTSRQ
jgi:cytochrome P450